MIYLLRHGQTEFNRQGRFQGRVDSPLTDLGRAQARAVAERLAALAADDPGEWRIETSPLGRAYATAEIVADRMGLPPPVLEPRLVEVSYGELEGLTRPEADAAHPEFINTLGVFLRAPGGEPAATFTARAAEWLGEIDPDDGVRRIAIAHASIGRVIRALYAGIAVDQCAGLETPQDAFHRLHDGRVERIDCQVAALP